MNYLHHPNLLVQFWASLNTEFDKILDSFVRGDGWLFQDMGVCAKRANVGSIYRCASTSVHSPSNGKPERRDHFFRVNFIILDAAKTQWLAPWRKYVVDPSKGVMPPFFKRQVGGFFLLYMFYSTLPSSGRWTKNPRICMDPRDLIAMHVFIATLKRLPKSDAQLKELTKQFVVLYNDLVNSEAFEFSAFNDYFVTTNASTRKLLAAKFCEFTQHIYTLKDLRDQLHYITYQQSPKVFQSLIAYGRQLTKVQQLKSNEKQRDEKANNEKDKTFHPVNEPWTLEQIQELEKETDIGKLAHNIPSILKSLDFGPILTRKRLTGLADNLLDKELDNCVSVYKTHQKLKEINKRRNAAVKKHRTDDCVPDKELYQNVWKLYMAGDLDWINGVTSKSNSKVPDVAKSDVVGNLNDNKSAGDVVDVDLDDDDEEGWETGDDEDDDNDEEVLSQFGNKLQLNKLEQGKKTCSPLKSDVQRSADTLFSMPTIDFPDLSSANKGIKTAMQSDNAPKKLPTVAVASPSASRLTEVKIAVKTRSGRVVKKKKMED
ncbi:unnamed protein product [Orchesella dallaii]|uniref:Uncharacterized protein n=1 Tax=Orchesella dallaii TaxID=48710 RepID=A0ABP1RDT1_9HEXA